MILVWIVTWRDVSVPLAPNAFSESWAMYGITVSNQWLSDETESRPVISLVREHQLRLYEDFVRFPDVDPAQRVVYVGGNREWRRPTGSQHSWWMGLVDRSCQKGLGLDSVAALDLFVGDRQEWQRRVSEATRTLVCAPSPPSPLVSFKWIKRINKDNIDELHISNWCENTPQLLDKFKLSKEMGKKWSTKRGRMSGTNWTGMQLREIYLKVLKGG